MDRFPLFSRLSLLWKINLAIAVVFLVVILIVTFYTGQREKEHALELAKQQTEDLTTFYFDSLNTMMLTNTMDQRTLLRNKILRRPGIVEARVIRGEPVKQQFGPGYPEEQPLDELDRRALAGERVVKEERKRGSRAITVVTPFEATESTRGVNCLQCHDVPAGAINGAIRVSFSLEQTYSRVDRELWLEFFANLALFGTGMVLVNLLLRRWITQPLHNLMHAVHERAAGNTSVRAAISSSDEIGRLAYAFNEMTTKVNESVRREYDAAQDLRENVDILLDVCSRAAKGDLSGHVSINRDDAIGELAQVIQIMIDNLNLLLQEKHEAVETLQEKVDRILEAVARASQGDLTGRVDVVGDDAIGQLARGVQRMIDSLNDLVTQVQRSGVQVTSSATEISATAKEQAATVAQQAATVNQIASASTQISATSKELVKTMDQVADIAEHARNSATAGRSGLLRMGANMQNVVEASGMIARKLEVLRDKAANINTVVTTITKVADQTNLLSLNAAIEAEKAGEHGVGFSVVANEIRRLADQTAVASWDIEQMIKEMQSAVSTGVMSVEKFAEEVRRSVDDVNQVSGQLGEVIEEVHTLTPRFESVHEGMQFQSQGAEQIKQAIAQLNESAQQTVESLRHSNAAIERLNEAAHGLQRGVSRLKVARQNA